MQFDADQFETLQHLLTWRRDVRHFKTDALPEGCIEKLQVAMELAPSVGNARPWRVIDVRSEALRMAVRAAFEEANAEAGAIYDDAAREAYFRLKLAGLEQAPLQLAVFTEVDPAEGRGLGRQSVPQTLEQSTAMAVFSLWLTARAMNLGVGMVSILDPKRMEALFEVPEGWRFSAYLCVGYPEFEDDTPLLHRAGWQENTEQGWSQR